MQLTYKIETEHLSLALTAAKKSIARPTKLFHVIGASELAATQRRHDQGLAPDGTPWAPLAKATLHAIIEKRQHQVTRVAGKRNGAKSDFRAAQKIMAGKRILFDNGDLLRFYYQVNGDDVVITTMDQKKAAWHHFGTGTHGPKGASYEIRPKVAKALAFGGLLRSRVIHPGIPARPLVGFPDSDRDMVGHIVVDHITQVIRQARP